MQILITGRGGSGSWQIRGVQLGEAIGAIVKPNATVKDMDAADVVVVVKRTTAQINKAIKQSGKPVLWDIVDCWPQGKGFTLEQAKSYVYAQAKGMSASACVFSTQAQQTSLRDLDGFVLRHHAMENQPRNPIREKLKTVGYQGSKRYVPNWVTNSVRRNGLRFVMNPANLAELDAVIACRADPYDDEVSRAWKSNVKLANAQATGTPCVMPYESGYLECDPVGPVYYRNRQEFEDAIDALKSYEERKIRAMVLRAGTPLLKDIAARYRQCILKFFGLGQNGPRKASDL
jgi:hypothetical protein